MSADIFAKSKENRPELFFALVGAVGTRLNDLSGALRDVLDKFGYQTVPIKISSLLHNFTGWEEQAWKGEDERIKHLQNMGNAFRKQLQRGDALALAGITAIQRERAKITGNHLKPAYAHAYIIHQLKHPDEVDLFRKVYGASFFLIAGHSTFEKRKELIQRHIAKSASKIGKEDSFEPHASELIRIDEKQDDYFGQNVRDTYPKADFFADLGKDHGENEVHRFVDLLFGHPFHTPQPDEYAMFQANAVSLRSSDDNRQVGAVIVSLSKHLARIRDINIVAVGMNEVPRGGGGFYWDQDSPDLRDQNLLNQGTNLAVEIKLSVLSELLEKIVQKNWLDKEVATVQTHDLANRLLSELKGTQFLDIGEFSRPVHAEMTAIIDAARRGVAVDGHSLYVTTFPCHNCAKHIIATGIRRVVYLEPYPKSRARTLYGEEIIHGKEIDGKVCFFAYTGIAPRQYQQLFSMSERGAKKGKALAKWNSERRSLTPIYVPQNSSLLYIDSENQELKKLPKEIFSFEKQILTTEGFLKN